MKTDIYTKTILTFIAILLTIIVVRDINFVSYAEAQTPVKVAAKDGMDKNRPSINNPSLQTTTQQQNLANASASKTDKKKDKEEERKIIDVNIVQVNGYDLSYYGQNGQIPVYLVNKDLPVYLKGIPYVKVSNYYDFLNQPEK